MTEHSPRLKMVPLAPGRIYSDDGLNINAAGMTISRAAYTRMGYPEKLAISVSEDGTAVQLAVPGPFTVRFEHNHTRPKGTGKARVNSKVIKAKAKLGHYRHSGENLFILE